MGAGIGTTGKYYREGGWKEIGKRLGKGREGGREEEKE